MVSHISPVGRYDQLDFDYRVSKRQDTPRKTTENNRLSAL